MHILVTSPRVAPGLMTLAAWDVLRSAATVRCPVSDDPTAGAVRSSGIDVTTDPVGPQDVDPAAVWIAPVGDLSWADEVAARLVHGDARDDIEVVFGSYDLPGARLLDLVAVMDRLRRECPWTQEQTHATLQPYLLEETYEVLDTLDRADHEHLREELGDLLMQVVFHAAVAQERPDGWSVDDVAESIVEKLVYRNPHVFGDEVVESAAEVDANWQRLKATAKPRASVLEGIPPTLPALAYADKVLGRLGESAAGNGPDDLGTRLLALVGEARRAGVDPEQVLRTAVNRLAAP